jgi:hypothetical protein
MTQWQTEESKINKKFQKGIQKLPLLPILAYMITEEISRNLNNRKM